MGFVVTFIGNFYGKKVVPIISPPMWYHVLIRIELVGCLKKNLKYGSFMHIFNEKWLKIMLKTHILSFFETPYKFKSYQNVVPHGWTDDRNNFSLIKIAYKGHHKTHKWPCLVTLNQANMRPREFYSYACRIFTTLGIPIK